jgi:hypothetical protein
VSKRSDSKPSMAKTGDAPARAAISARMRIDQTWRSLEPPDPYTGFYGLAAPPRKAGAGTAARPDWISCPNRDISDDAYARALRRVSGLRFGTSVRRGWRRVSAEAGTPSVHGRRIMNNNDVFDARNHAFFAKALARNVDERSPQAARRRGTAHLSGSAGRSASTKRQAALRRDAARGTAGRFPASSCLRDAEVHLDCAGCYSKALRPDGMTGELATPLSPSCPMRVLELFREAMDLGTWHLS